MAFAERIRRIVLCKKWMHTGRRRVEVLVYCIESGVITNGTDPWKASERGR